MILGAQFHFPADQRPILDTLRMDGTDHDVELLAKTKMGRTCSCDTCSFAVALRLKEI